MHYLPSPKLIIFQASLAFLNSKVSAAWKDPFATLFETNAAVAFSN